MKQRETWTKRKCVKIQFGICLVGVIISAVSNGWNIQFFQRAESDDFYFNMITLNSVIAGFAFTNLGLLLGAASTEVVQKISNTDIMKRKNDKLMISIIFTVAAMLLSLLFVVDLGSLVIMFLPLLVVQIVANGLYIASIIMMVIGIVYFVKSIIEISQLLDTVYRNRSKLTNKQIENIHSELRKDKGEV